MYDNFVFSHQTFPAMDASIGRPILTTGTRPRVILQLSMYNLTNTAASEIGVFIIPETQGLGILADGTTPVAGNVTFAYGKVDASLAGTTEQQPLQWCPFGTKGTGPQYAIVPPNCMVVIACVGTNMNGTANITAISAEVGYA